MKRKKIDFLFFFETRKMLRRIREPEPELVKEVLEGEFSLCKELGVLHWLAQVLPLSELEKLHSHPAFSHMNFLSYNPHLTVEFVLAHMHWNWDWQAISANRAFTWRDVVKHSRAIPWRGRGLSLNPNITLRDAFSQKSAELGLVWEFEFLSRNPGITFWEVWEHPELPWRYSHLRANPNFKPEHFLRLWKKNPLEGYRDGEKRLLTCNPPPLDWFQETPEKLLQAFAPLELSGKLEELVKLLLFQGVLENPKLVDFLLESAPLEGETLSLLVESYLERSFSLGIEGLIGLLYLNPSLRLLEVLKLPQAHKLVRSYLLLKLKFTEEELLSSFQEGWDVAYLLANPCFTFRCYKELHSRIPRKSFKHCFLACSLPMQPAVPFNFPELSEEQWRLYPSLTRGARLELAITYWALALVRTRVTRKKGRRLGRKTRVKKLRGFPRPPRLPKELVALVASWVLGRIHPYCFFVPKQI